MQSETYMLMSRITITMHQKLRLLEQQQQRLKKNNSVYNISAFSWIHTYVYVTF